MFTDLAVLARVAVRTGTVVLVRFCVHTRPSVLAGSVGAAVVQICARQDSCELKLALPAQKLSLVVTEFQPDRVIDRLKDKQPGS